MADVAGLLRLQDIDSRLADLKASLSVIETQIADDAELRRRKETVAAARQAYDAVSAELNQRDADFALLRKRAQDLNRKLYGGSVQNPADLLTMGRELEQLQGRVAEEESALLELMQAAELKQEPLRQAEEAAKAAERSRNEKLQQLQEQRAALDAERKVATAERESAVAAVDKPTLQLYERVASKHHPAIARLEGDRCGGCHLPLAPHEIHAIKSSGALVQCSNCDRILVP